MFSGVRRLIYLMTTRGWEATNTPDGEFIWARYNRYKDEWEYRPMTEEEREDAAYWQAIR